MIDVVAMDAKMWGTARRQAEGDIEQASFFLAQPHRDTLVCHAMRVVETPGFERQSAVHIALTDEFATDLIQWAAHEGSCLVELHSHTGNGRLCLSPTDVSGLDDWVPHVRWRLGGLPYAALVQSAREIDGLVWSDGSDPNPLRIVEVAGRASVAATGLSYQRWYA